MADRADGVMAAGPSIVRLTPDGGRPTMLCLPHAGAGVGACRWLRGLDLGLELHAVELPGRERRIHEAPWRRAAPLVEALAHSILCGEVPVPCLIYGHSMGALLALALARRLGPRRPRALVLGGASPPHLPRPGPLRHRQDDATLRAELRRMGGAPADVLDSPELLALLLPALRADLELCESENFADGPPLECDLHVLVGRSDPLAPACTASGWRRYTRRRLSIHAFEGGHFFHHERTAEVGASLMRITQQYLDGHAPM